MISEASLVKKVPELESTHIKKTEKKSQLLSFLNIYHSLSVQLQLAVRDIRNTIAAATATTVPPQIINIKLMIIFWANRVTPRITAMNQQ